MRLSENMTQGSTNNIADGFKVGMRKYGGITMLYNIVSIEDKRVVLTLKDGNMSATFRGLISIDGSVLLVKLLSGRINETQFESKFDRNNLDYKTIGRGRKPQHDINAMDYFLKECVKYSNIIRL